MGELKGIYALWYREIKVFLRERSRIVASIVTPILWLLVIGGGLGSQISFRGINYQSFIYPGVLVQSALFSSIFFGVYIVWDRKIDFLKEVLVAPMSRVSTFLGKALGGATDSLIQSVILLVIGFAFLQLGLLSSISFSPATIAVCLLILFITIIALVSLGLTMGSLMESPEGFQLVSSFLIFPMFFLSGALFPITNLPAWLAPLVFVNPITYSVDGLRGALLGAGMFPLTTDLAVMLAFAIIMIFVGTQAFKRMNV